jgi:hypothetical protein
MDRTVNAAVAAVESRSRTAEAVVTTLAAMGYRAEPESSTADAPVILGTKADGRTARIRLTGDTEIEIDSTFTEPSSSVAPGTAGADAICEEAVLEQAAFHRGIEAQGLSGGTIYSAGRPTRAPSPTPARRRAYARTQPARRAR